MKKRKTETYLPPTSVKLHPLAHALLMDAVKQRKARGEVRANKNHVFNECIVRTLGKLPNGEWRKQVKSGVWSYLAEPSQP